MTLATDDIVQHIQALIDENPIVLFMKGTASLPQCGFSALVVTVLGRLGVPFKDVNILENQALRQGIKDFSDWPTLPQLYIKGEFMGGADIVREMYESGELEQVLAKHQLLAQKSASA